MCTDCNEIKVESEEKKLLNLIISAGLQTYRNASQVKDIEEDLFTIGVVETVTILLKPAMNYMRKENEENKAFLELLDSIDELYLTIVKVKD